MPDGRAGDARAASREGVSHDLSHHESRSLVRLPWLRVVERAPLQGGQVACSLPRPARVAGPDATRRAAAGGDTPRRPARVHYLRAQDAHPRQVPPTLQAVLGGMNVQPGREQEALAIWQSLRARSQQGDVSASED